MSKKLIVLSSLLFFIVMLAVFGQPFANRIIDSLSGETMICENGLCSSCIINGASCTCDDDTCECGETVVARERCSLMGGTS